MAIIQINNKALTFDKIIYLNGTLGLDDNNGNTRETSVKTISKAQTLCSGYTNPAIILGSDITFNGNINSNISYINDDYYNTNFSINFQNNKFYISHENINFYKLKLFNIFCTLNDYDNINVNLYNCVLKNLQFRSSKNTTNSNINCYNCSFLETILLESYAITINNFNFTNCLIENMYTIYTYSGRESWNIIETNTINDNIIFNELYYPTTYISLGVYNGEYSWENNINNNKKDIPFIINI